MSIYSATKASELDRCLNSLSRQTLPATEIVIVRDGPIHTNVERCIHAYESKLPLYHLTFNHNRGLGLALHDGLEACNYELVARVDSDDWSVSERFEKQTKFLQREPNVSLVGSWLQERYHVGSDIILVMRHSPTEHVSIRQIAKRRNPINHPTVMFRKFHVLDCGSYESCTLFEDYLLWTKMLTRGYLFHNLPEVLVETEVDTSYFQRRGGFGYLNNEIRLLQKLRQTGFLSLRESGIFAICRLPMRISPVPVRQYLYKTFLRS